MTLAEQLISVCADSPEMLLTCDAGRLFDLALEDNCLSSVITGPSRFPVDRAAKANRVEEKRLEKFLDHFEFPGKPDDQTRSLLKSNGFKWTPSQNHWGRKLTGNASEAVRQVMVKLNTLNALATK